MPPPWERFFLQTFLARNWKSVWRKREEIMKRRRVNDEYMASWFHYAPVTRPAPKVSAKVLSRSRAVQG